LIDLDALEKLHMQRLTRITSLWRAGPGLLALAALTLAACGKSEDPKSPDVATKPPRAAGQVDSARLAGAEREPDMWLTGGRDAGQTYYSPLTAINAGNVKRLGFAWEYRTETQRGLEATPIVVDGVLYTSGAWGLVYALDPVTGKEIWKFDPHNDGQRARFACCDFVNRGVAVWKGRVYVGSLDGRLFALDAANGKTIWEADTIVDRSLPYTSTGAPAVAGDLVIIGNSGADVGPGGVRGYVSAFDLDTGRFKWRFYTVPACGEKTDDPDQLRAQRTWSSDCSVNGHGGGTVWDGISYDPDLKLVYIGTGNAAPYLRGRKPHDDLYVASIVALHASNGRVAWHYQTTPGDIWDYANTAKMILTDLTINGRTRKVLMQAPKNGFFYVIDRTNGEVLSAKPFAEQNWALGMDEHFRPIPNPKAFYYDKPALIAPTTAGAHKWAAMSFNPQTGLVYIPVLEAYNIMVNLSTNPGALVHHMDGGFSTSIAPMDDSYREEDYTPVLGSLPKISPRPKLRNVLRAWDPVAQRVVWEKDTWQGLAAFPGGTMTSAGGLVFQGNVDGRFNVFDARSGELLKSIETGTTIMASPMTYQIDGIQYVSVMASWGGSMASLPYFKGVAPYDYQNIGRILTFRLDGAAETPKPPARVEIPVQKPLVPEPARDVVLQGSKLFVTNCSRCHGFSAGINPDLSRSMFGSADPKVFRSIVLGGALASGGMGRFDDVLSSSDADALFAYITDMRWKAYKTQQAAGGKPVEQPSSRKGAP